MKTNTTASLVSTSASALILTFSPREKERLCHVFGFTAACPANPVAQIFKAAANVSPSPWGEGWDEGGRKIKLS
jgi:hypothetical protein